MSFGRNVHSVHGSGTHNRKESSATYLRSLVRRIKMHIGFLPDEILVNIFLKLPIVELVENIRRTCTRWCLLSYNSCLWKAVPIWGNDEARLQVLVEAIRESSDSILNISFGYYLDDKFKPYVILLRQGIHYTNLKRLSVRRYFTTDDIANICSAFPFLEQFSLIGDAISLQDITQLKNLRYLEVDNEFRKEFALNLGIDTLAGFSNLSTLILICNNLQDSFINSIFKGSSLLKKLELHSKNMTINAFIDFPGKGIALESLKLGGTGSITDEGFMYIFRNAPNLLSLYLGHNSNITEMSIVHLADVCSKLESLTIQHVSRLKMTGTGMNALADKCPNIRLIDLHKLFAPNDINLKYLATKCKKLEQLKLHSFPFADESICFLSIYAANLRVLELYDNDLITGNSISQIVIKCQNLKILNLLYCKKVINLNFDEFHQQKTRFDQEPLITCNSSCYRFDHQFITAAQPNVHGDLRCSVDHDTHLERRPRHSHLNEITLYQTSINNGSFMQIAKHCPDLVLLRAMGGEIHDDATEALVANCHYLQSLHLPGHELTDAGLRSINELGSNLKYVTISPGTRGVNDIRNTT